MPTDPSTTGRSPSRWAVFKERDFSAYTASRLLSWLANQTLVVGIGWLVYDLTGSALALGFAGLATFLPAVTLALVAGEVADRVDRRLILIASLSVMAAASGVLAAYAVADAKGTAIIYAVLVVFGAARAFSFPASQALLPNLVQRHQFANAVALNSGVGQIATVTGPALGGLLYAFGPAVVFGAAAMFQIASLCLIATIRPRPLAARSKTNWTSLVAGIAFIRSRPAILGAISLDLFAVLLGGATALLPIYARDILQVGPTGLGVLRSMPALGALAMALILAWHPLTRRSGHALFAAVALFGIATIVFGLSTSLYLSLGALFVLGAADMVSVYVRSTLVQADTPDDMRGRVSAVNSVFIGASNELGEFESGVLAALTSTVTAVVIGGVGTLVVAVLWMRLFPSLRDRDRLVG
jgi:MFS family permease